jgi:AraC-like DNA-binding protein
MAADFVLMQGSAAATDAHAHYAHQLLLCADSPVTLQLDGVELSGRRLLIESMREHAIVAAPAPMFTIFAEPVTIAAEALQALADVPLDLPSLAQAMRGLARRSGSDPRVVEALAQIDRSLAGKVEAGELARRVDLSLSQLERLFAAELGLPIRRMVRWRRLRLALALALQAMPLTAAAHEAGFADSAHLSRTMRDMFGVRADRLLPGMRVKLID